MKYFEKMSLEHHVFERMDFFGQNTGMRAGCSRENRRFLTKYGHESSNFFMKIRKKRGILLTFLAHNIV